MRRRKKGGAQAITLVGHVVSATFFTGLLIAIESQPILQRKSQNKPAEFSR